MKTLTCKYITQVAGACILIAIAAAGSAHLPAGAAASRNEAAGARATGSGSGSGSTHTDPPASTGQAGAAAALLTNTPTRTPTACPTFVLGGSIGPGDRVQNGRLNFDTISSCGFQRSCPGQADTDPRRFDAYTFSNRSNQSVCVSVTLFTGECMPGQAPSGNRFMDSASYLGNIAAGDLSSGGALCENYLADVGATQGPNLSYGFTVPPGSLFTLVLNEAFPGVGCAHYNLAVSGCVNPEGFPTATPTQTPLSRLLVGHVKWQGLPDQPHPLQQQPISLTLRSGQIAVEYPIQLTDTGGNFTVTTFLPNGEYDWHAKGALFLANAGTLRLAGEPVIREDMGVMRTGDLDPDNVVNVEDFLYFRLNFGEAGALPGGKP